METPSWKLALSFVGAAGISAALTILYLGMRAVMQIGGSCASGGPYEVRIECPTAVPVLMPLSIFGGLGCVFLFLWAAPVPVRPWVVLAWTALFGSLGWNFIDAGLPWHDHGFEVLGILLGLMFWIMAAVPLVVLIVSRSRGTPVYRPARPVYISMQTPRGSHTTFTGPDPDGGNDISAALSQLAALHRSGDLTDDEYAKAKSRLLEGP